MGRQDGSTRQVSADSVDSSTAPILHVDLDAFFASVELLERPDLADLPVVVAHNSLRSVVTAANYPARKFGVRSAIPLSRALQLCPSAIVLEPHFEKYRHYSRLVMSIFDDMTPLVERLGIDEAFLDVAGARGVIGPPGDVARLIRERVRAETGLACSVGAAATKFVAKLASGRAKPDGLLVIPRSETLSFLHPLPVGALWGVGAVTEKSLLGRGLHTIGDIAQTPLDVLRRVVGDAGGRKLHALANGIDPRPVTRDTAEKSIGHEVTFEIDVSDAGTLRRELLRQASQVGRRLRASGLEGRTVVLKLRYADFTTITRSRTLAEPTDVGRRIADEVRDLYEAVGAHPPVRLIGVRMEQLTDAGTNAAGLWDDDEDWRGAERVIDDVGERFGTDLVRPASLMKPAAELGPSKRRPHL
ncbi:DNA polymerase-4 [Cryobacterium mesophilum]|uniref:DNA polymerase IV n=1 Tax=Terrimesophilobacter mesophilus TaxID=433647 RepID=A0A4R8V8R9_9MICO|nr:DNA polymerase IV [Terrimesophilobacter mesophilus]MBB5632404.1 DNA polymerase-4 [Terrimesophilobacter mesophilus]TFB79239.1 DNA polymerase IV [Terrimesophilobacter mesophilus]